VFEFGEFLVGQDRDLSSIRRAFSRPGLRRCVPRPMRFGGHDEFFADAINRRIGDLRESCLNKLTTAAACSRGRRAGVGAHRARASVGVRPSDHENPQILERVAEG